MITTVLNRFPWTRRTLPLLLGTFLCTSSSIVQAQYKYISYPDYLTVLDHAYATYRIDCENCEIDLVKDPFGWSLAMTAQDDTREVHELWSFAKERYVRPKGLMRLEKDEASSVIQPNADSPWTAAFYRYCPYFGYPGWFQDVIKEYDHEESLPDSIVYGVARSFASAARCRISDQMDECPIGYGYVQGEDGNQLTPKEIAEYKVLADRTIHWYDRLVSMDPMFETHIGEATLKRDNEIVSNYIDLMLVQNEADARPFLRSDLYDPFYRAMARNFLNSCDSNAVLFTNGDSDSFPLWYVQAVEGYRTDVRVLNMSLLNLGRYIRVVRQGPWGSEPLELVVNDMEWAHRGSQYIMFRNDSTVLISASEVLGTLKAYLSKDIISKEALVLDHNKILISSEDGHVLEWKLPKHYLLRNGLAMLDILQALAFDRPIHWAVTSSPEIYRGLDDHLTPCGLTLKLLPLPLDTLKQQDEIHRNASLFLEYFDWTDVQQRSSNKDRFTDTYRIQISRAAEVLLSIGDTLMAKAMLDRCVVLFPDSNEPYGRSWLLPMELYYAMGFNEDADMIALRLLKNLRTVPFERMKYSESGGDDTVLMRQHLWDRIRRTAIDQDRSHVIGAMDSAPETWPK